YPGIKEEEGLDMPCLLVPVNDLLGVMKYLKEQQRYNFLASLTAVDYQADNQIEVVYHLMSVPEANLLRVKVRVDREQPEVPSLTGLWPAANVQEREAYDLMGVIFVGHPDLKRILCPDDMVGHPLRKDFQLQEAEGGA
ncbi:MAG: NADH-quinone oxidoreductase subunit C, partial [Clostridia bacterium]|nr:NADH-quinone oxidoreductase subunit C [Clostridia bacterium]